jgi:hypothetical protein
MMMTSFLPAQTSGLLLQEPAFWLLGDVPDVLPAAGCSMCHLVSMQSAAPLHTAAMNSS